MQTAAQRALLFLKLGNFVDALTTSIKMRLVCYNSALQMFGYVWLLFRLEPLFYILLFGWCMEFIYCCFSWSACPRQPASNSLHTPNSCLHLLRLAAINFDWKQEGQISVSSHFSAIPSLSSTYADSYRLGVTGSMLVLVLVHAGYTAFLIGQIPSSATGRAFTDILVSK